MTGRKLFEKRNKESIAQLAEQGVSNRVANHQTALKQLWDGLTADEQAEWCVEAASEDDPPGIEHIFQYVNTTNGLRFISKPTPRNQSLFTQRMTRVLLGMIGMGKNQVGPAAFHLQYAYRNKFDVVETGASVITVAPNNRSPLFRVSVGKHKHLLTVPFTDQKDYYE